MFKKEKILFILSMFSMICSCGISQEKFFPKKNNQNLIENNINNVMTDDCAWFYRGKQLNKNQIDSLKALIYKKQTNVKVSNVSSNADSLLKYKVKKGCLVVLE